MNYKRNKLILLFIVIMTIMIFIIYLIFMFHGGSASKAKQNVKNSEKVRIGMTKNEVLGIMGDPDEKHISYFNDIDTMYFYTPPFMSSGGIYIHFEDSNDRVNRIILND